VSSVILFRHISEFLQNCNSPCISTNFYYRLDPQQYTKDLINQLIPFGTTEADWPHLSWVTGYTTDTSGLTPGPVSSLYLKMRERNRCIHRGNYFCNPVM
jgi:hypothetical protein